MRITLKQKNILITLAKGETLAIAAILNMNFCNYIIDEICKKLNTKNITHSVYIAAYYKLI